MRALCLILLVTGLVACGGNDTPNDSSKEKADPGSAEGASSRPEDKKAPKSPEKVKLDSGVEYLDMIVGDGPAATKGSEVNCHATGWTKDGKKFWSSYDTGKSYDFFLGPGRRNSVVRGWIEGVPGMKVGGKRKLWIPWNLGYPQGNPGAGIPPRTDIVFEVELLAVK